MPVWPERWPGLAPRRGRSRCALLNVALRAVEARYRDQQDPFRRLMAELKGLSLDELREHQAAALRAQDTQLILLGKEGPQ